MGWIHLVQKVSWFLVVHNAGWVHVFRNMGLNLRGLEVN